MSYPIYVLGGPNLNLLGTREPEIYGTATLEDLERLVRAHSGGEEIVFRQSNHEGELVDWIQEAGKAGSVLIINAAAYTHTSIALHDALKSITIPIIEVHLSNPTAREDFRHTNFVAPLASATIAGLGAHGYVLAMDAARHLISLGGKSPK
ncbi:MAG: type II 3-dehydroquinate dehydratase [Pseudomonadota bacterium]